MVCITQFNKQLFGTQVGAGLERAISSYDALAMTEIVHSTVVRWVSKSVSKAGACCGELNFLDNVEWEGTEIVK